MRPSILVAGGWVAIAALAGGGCGPRFPGVYDYPQPPAEQRYETVWVNPEVVLADSLVTLIRAERLDSVLVGPDERGPTRAAAVAFAVEKEACPVVVTLADWRDEVVRPLLARRLEPGLYRLTLNTAAGSLGMTPGRWYFLKADVCGRKVREAIVRE